MTVPDVCRAIADFTQRQLQRLECRDLVIEIEPGILRIGSLQFGKLGPCP